MAADEYELVVAEAHGSAGATTNSTPGDNHVKKTEVLPGWRFAVDPLGHAFIGSAHSAAHFLPSPFPIRRDMKGHRLFIVPAPDVLGEQDASRHESEGAVRRVE